MGEVIFVLGGTRSGKTAFAQKLASGFEAHSGLPVTYVATAEGGDEEMRRRIAKHRSGRPDSWRTREEPLHPARAVAEAVRESSAVILDCLTLFVTNHLLKMEKLPPEEAEDLILRETRKILDAAESGAAPVVIVSNEVGVGLVSSYELGRRFQDAAGAVHQCVASRAGNVYFLVAGIAQKLK